MRTLILCVDRDDDVGRKGRVATPVVGRRANVDAAMALGLADPEDSDTNAIFAAVNLYDRMHGRLGGDQVEVATITGHERLGVRGDRKLAEELEAVLAKIRPDEVILVSDGAEDERILPVIQSRVRVGHVHRSVVKQAPRLEGFYYVLARLLDDRKQAMRFVLPLGIILLAWGVARIMGLQDLVVGATLGFGGLWLIIHAMKWEGAVGRFFADVGDGMQKGRLTVLFNVGALAVLIFGALQAWETLQPDAYTTYERNINGVINSVHVDRALQALYFMDGFLPWLVGGLLVLTIGQLFDSWVREGRAGIRYWGRGFALFVVYLLGSVFLQVVIDAMAGVSVGRALVQMDRAVRLVMAAVIWAGATVLTRYIRSYFPANT